jgi:MFS family permease
LAVSQAREPSPLLSVAALLISVGFLVTGNGLQMMLLPIRGGIEGFSAVQLGFMGSGYYLGFVLGCLGTPLLLRRAGHVRTFAALVSIASAVALLYPMLVHPLAWAALRLITGFCLAGLYLIVESWINDRATRETRGALISTYVAINYIVTTLGQMTVTLFETSSFMLFSIASVLVSVAAVPLALSRSPEPKPPELARFRPLHLFRLSPAGTVSIFLIGLGTGALWSLGPVFAESRSGNVTSAALFMSVAVLGGALAQWPIGRLSDSLDRRYVLIGVTAAAALACLVIATLPDLGGPWLVFAFAFGATILPAYAVASAHVFDFAERADYVEVSAGLLLLYGLGSTIGPALASFGMQRFGPVALLGFIALVQVAIIAFVALRMTRRKSLSEADKQSFDLVATAPVVTVGAAQDENAP